MKNCIKCHTSITRKSKSGMCRSCVKLKPMVSYFCKDCNARITKRARTGFCKSCWQKGERNSSYGNKYRLGIKHTEEAKIKMVETRRRNGNLGKMTEEMKKKISHNSARIWLGKKIPKENIRKGVQTRIKNGTYVSTPETKLKQSLALRGEKCHLWRGGLSFEPYSQDFNNIFKQAIRKRDNQTCMLCDISQEKNNRALSIHHINYDKLLSIPQNCISLCDSCHPKTNQNRKHWETFFQNLLAEKYNYKYKDKEVIIEIPLVYKRETQLQK